MKNTIHPKYHPEAKITCACGAIYQVGSTSPEIHVEICSKCHPFYTGKVKIIDAARRVEKFQEKAAKKEAAGTTTVGKRAKLEKRAQKRAERGPKATPEESIRKTTAAVASK